MQEPLQLIIAIKDLIMCTVVVGADKAVNILLWTCIFILFIL